jgi:hypothetical protein
MDEQCTCEYDTKLMVFISFWVMRLTNLSCHRDEIGLVYNVVVRIQANVGSHLVYITSLRQSTHLRHNMLAYT